MKKTAKLISKMLIIPVTIALLAISNMGVAYAADTDQVCNEGEYSIGEGIDCIKGDDQPTELFGDGGIFTTITNTILYVLGAISVIMLIYGGIRYTVSGGESTQVTAAKNTILYAVVGVVVALLAYAIINFVINGLIG